MTVPIVDRGHELLAIYGLFVALTTIAVSLRTYCRVILNRGRACGWDDIFALVAWASFICFAGTAIAGIHHGSGQHAWHIKSQIEVAAALKFWWLSEPVYVIANLAIKASIALMLLRIATQPVHRAIVRVVLLVTVLFSTGYILFLLFQCWPPQFFYTRLLGAEGSCVRGVVTLDLGYAYTAVLCVGDWAYAVLPCVLLWNVQMPRTQKALVSLILAMGGIASIATIARIPYLHTMGNEKDFLYNTTDVVLWSCTETGLAITAACCATLRPLFRSWSSAPESRDPTPMTEKPDPGHGNTVSLDPGLCDLHGGRTGYAWRCEGRSEREALETREDGVDESRTASGGVFVQRSMSILNTSA